MKRAPIVVFDSRNGIPGVSRKYPRLTAESLREFVAQFEESGRYEFVQVLISGANGFQLIARDHQVQEQEQDNAKSII